MVERIISPALQDLSKAGRGWSGWQLPDAILTLLLMDL